MKIVGTALGVFLGGWLVLYSINRFGFFNNETLTPQEVASVKAYDLVSKDGDNDGLKDWEEAIWNTDPQNPDTDGDGTNDEEEVASHRDPTIAGPNDFLYGYDQSAVATNINATSTLTGQLSANLLTRYLISKGLNSGDPLDEQQKKNLDASFTQDFQKKVTEYHQDEFFEKDVVVSTLKSPKQYINDLAWADATYYKGLTSLELNLFKDAIATNDPSKLKELDPYIVASAKHIDFLKKEEVPTNYTDLHLELLNIVNNSKYADEKMKNFEKDPLDAIAASQYFGTQMIRYANVLKNLKTQIDKDGITFNKNEYGAQFYNNLSVK